METYHVRELVEMDGSVLLSGLPPYKEVEIIVLEGTDLPGEMQGWLSDIRVRYPFAKMGKEEILNLTLLN